MASHTATLTPALQINLDRLRSLNTKDIQTRWHYHQQDIQTAEVLATGNANQWPLTTINDQQHIAWDKGLKILWLYQTITVLTDFNGYPLTGLILRLALTWWADDAQIYVDGVLVQSGDLFECFTRICLSQSVKPGNQFQVAIRLVSPGHDDGALVRSQLIYELPSHQPTPEPSFIADELTVLATLEPQHQPKIEAALSQLNWNSLSTKLSNTTSSTEDALNVWQNLSLPSTQTATIHPFQQSLSQLRRTLIPLCSELKKRTIECVGHAHLDMAWLWPIADTWDAAERTFKSVLNLQKDFPELTYTHSSPALFEWIEQNSPALFEQIQAKVKEESWSIDAGLWIEPEFNIISGEAIARHILYGQRYCQEKFGKISKIAWLPDSFGFCWQLPQLLTQGGIETFATLKLTWNDTTEFPHQIFWWQSPDGSRILSIMLPPIGSDIDPEKMAAQSKKWSDSTDILNTLWLPGLGDHGGGPTRDMLEKSRRWEKSPFFPQLSFTTPNQYIENLSIQPSTSLPVWKDELYLELHRGCYTTHAEQKQSNRQAEDLLYQAEVFATVAQIVAEHPYPKTNIEKAWKMLLFNQFHDILPGTSISEVFVEADQGWKQIQQIGQDVLDQSLEAIASTIKLPPSPHPNAKPILIFNSLAWQRDAVITFDLSEIDAESTQFKWIVYSPDQQIISSQNALGLLNEKTPHQLLFLASDIPALGYQCYWVRPTDTLTEKTKPTEYVLENQFLKAVISPRTGQIASLIEKTTQKETFSSPGNQLQIFQDQCGYWNAWNIASDYEKHPLPNPELFSIQWIENGPIRQRIRTTHETDEAFITQDYILDTHAHILTVESDILWEENQAILKVKFPLDTRSNNATYETAFGAIIRPTISKTKKEEAKWEVPALRWADLNDERFGASILTKGKHGFDATPSCLRLTLLKSPIWPDSTADRGWHQFTYAIYPHSGSWQNAHTVRRAREFNIAPVTFQPKSALSRLNPHSSTEGSFFKIHNHNIVMSTLKPSENHSEEFILRCYEAHGETTDIKIENSINLSVSSKGGVRQTDLLERPVTSLNLTSIEPWQVLTYCFKKERPS